jgi:integrase
MAAYLREHAPTKASSRWIAGMAEPILQWWGEKPLLAIRGTSCRDYIAWRTRQPIRKFKRCKPTMVSAATARHELEVLRAAIHYYHREHGPLTSVPVISMPAKAPQRQDYFLTRSEIARRIRIARRRPDARHLVRLFLLGLYTGSRPTVMLRLRWLPSTDAGWIDLDAGVIYRQPPGAVRTKKRAPPCRIHTKLLPSPASMAARRHAAWDRQRDPLCWAANFPLPELLGDGAQGCPQHSSRWAACAEALGSDGVYGGALIRP